MALRVDDNLDLNERDGKTFVICAHCQHEVAELGTNYNDGLAFHEGSPSEAGPQIWKDASVFIDRAVVFRQWYCPSCFTAVRTEVVPTDHPIEMDKALLTKS
jgi:N-methylhydantoinase B